MRSFLISILFLIAVTTALADFKSEEEAISFITQEENETEENIKQLIVKCIENSWWTAGEKTILSAYNKKVDISDEFKKAVSKQRANIQKLQNLINKNKEDYTVISPAFQWAQGKVDLKMNIKLSYKWDTPATLGCSVESVKFESQSVYFEAKCPSSKKKYVLNLRLQNRINPEACSWNESAVGRVIINMIKYESGLWDNIIVKMKNMPKNIHTWWSMQDQLEKEDKEKEEAEQKRLDEQRREAERIYWEQKKQQEEAEAAEKKEEAEKKEVPVSEEETTTTTTTPEGESEL